MDESLFPREITAPSDQLLQMAKVADAIKKSESSLDDYFGENAETYKTAAKTEFEDAMTGYLPELAQIRKYYEQRAREKSEKAEAIKLASVDLSKADVAMLGNYWKTAKEAKRKVERAVSRNLMTDADNRFVERLLRREASLDDIPEGLNAKGIRAVFEAKEEYAGNMEVLNSFNRQRKAALREEADSYLSSVKAWKDKTSGFAYARETMERNIRDIVKSPNKFEAEIEANDIIKRYFSPVHENEAKATKMKNEYRERVRDLDISQKKEKGNKQSEAAAVQFLGEAYDNISALSGPKIEKDAVRNGKTLEEWKAEVQNFKAQNPKLDYAKVDKDISEFKKIYDELFQQMNEARIQNGYEPIDYRRGYFPHFQNGETDGTLASFGKALGIKMDVSELPTSINGITHLFKPGIQWTPEVQQRQGFTTDYDAVQGFDKYIEGAASVVNHTADIQSLRALADQIRYRSTEDGIREQVDKLRSDRDLSVEEREERIREVYDVAPTTLSNFIGNLDEYTNLLAGKKSQYDRNMERLIGRKSYNLVKGLENRVASNMVTLNPGSWITNFIPLAQGSAGVSQKEMLGAMWDTLKAYKTDDGFADTSSFLTNRRGSDPLVKTWSEKASGKLSLPMEFIDTFTADTLVRARVEHNLKQGMNESDAMSEADGWAAGIMADRSKGSEPTLFAATNPVMKVFTQFQLEVNNQLSWLFKDVPREQKEKGMLALTTALLKFFIGSWIYNELYEKFVGRRPALDPIGMLNDFVGDVSGKKLPNSIDMLRDAMQGKKIDFSTEKKSAAETGAGVAKNVAENIPFVGGLMGGGRLPINSALPNVSNVWNASAGLLSGEGNARKNKDTLVRELEKPVAYILPPFGGGQAKKTIQGIRGVSEGGRYGVDNQGRDVLQYPMAKGETIQSILFGPTSTQGGQKWIESGFKSLSADATDVYKKLVDAGSRERDAYDFVKQLAGAQKTGSQSKRDVQIGMLAGSKLNEDQKLIAYRGMMASDKEKAVIDTIGVSEGDLSAALAKIGQASKAEDKRTALAASGLPDDEKEIIYTKLISDKNPEIVKTCLKDGVSMDEYMKYADAFEGSKDYAKKYQSMKTAGLSGSSAAEILTGLADLKPVAGKNEVTFVQKLRVIADSDLSDEQKLQAVGAALDKTTVQKVNQARGYGINVDLYTEFQETLPRFDANGNGSYTQAEVKAALDNMQLSNKERAVLWQLRTGGKKNPYDAAIGANIRAEAAADKQAAKGQTVQDVLFGGNSGGGKSGGSSGAKKRMTANEVLFG